VKALEQTFFEKPSNAWLKSENRLWCHYCSMALKRSKWYFHDKKIQKSKYKATCKNCVKTYNKLHAGASQYGNYKRSLSQEQVREIRELPEEYMKLHGSTARLARKYNVSRKTIFNVRNSTQHYRWVKPRGKRDA
jgi:Mor family transcriptional regulator